MSGFAKTRTSDIVLIFLVDYILLKMKESWVGAVVLHIYQQELKKNLIDHGASWKVREKLCVCACVCVCARVAQSLDDEER